MKSKGLGMLALAMAFAAGQGYALENPLTNLNLGEKGKALMDSVSGQASGFAAGAQGYAENAGQSVVDTAKSLPNKVIDGALAFNKDFANGTVGKQIDCRAGGAATGTVGIGVPALAIASAATGIVGAANGVIRGAGNRIATGVASGAHAATSTAQRAWKPAAAIGAVGGAYLKECK